jgi:hypothetical protein
MEFADRTALDLLAQLQRLAGADGETGLRLTIRSADGDYIGEVKLPAKAGESLTGAVDTVASYAGLPPLESYNIVDLTSGLHPDAVNELEAHFGSVDPKSYLADLVAADNEDAAERAYESLVLREDGDL